MSCKAQDLSKSLKTEVVKFYIEINEIQKEDEQELLKNFDELFTITDLQNTTIKYSNSVTGLYKISPNISHTTSNILLCNTGKYMVLKANNDSKETLSAIISFIKEREEIDKKHAIQYIDSFLKLIRKNKEIKDSNTLEFKEN